ncbi:enoyl-CoA hydratase/isomerase family protein [Sphingobium mellinum]|uniref:enoyl-CoA hydratase/isomerase family protein n=1 Tax=Sphingobium mellinum TaxID=1387166 RepID=UPI0030EC40AA
MSEILLEKRDGGAFVTFNRPEARNALNPEMLLEMRHFLDSIRDDPDVRYLALQGAGGNFSAGGDLAAYAETLSLSDQERSAFFETRVGGNGACFLSLDALTIPVISLVQGAAAGAGLSFLLASDFVLATEDATLVFAQTRVGLPLDLSLTYHLPRVVGAKKARQLAFTGARLDANQARELGIIDEIHAVGELEGALATLVRSFAATAPAAAARTKNLINSSGGFGLADQMHREVLAIGQCVTEPDFREGVEAFLAKRRAVFKGRRQS